VYTIDSACAVIQAAASEAEEQSEDLAAAFTTGEKNIEDFLKEFLPLRNNAHSLKLQSEKLMEEMNKPNRVPKTRSAPAPPPHGFVFSDT
jgi:hypothetical protein